MNRTIALLVVGLLALGALEFGLLGAHAAGFGTSLPPIVNRGVLPATVTATPTRTATAEHFITVTPTPKVVGRPASIQITPDPIAIVCDGAQFGKLHVHVTDANGNAVADGTTVYFSPWSGPTVLSTSSAQTVDGDADVTVGSNQFVQVGALLDVHIVTGLLDTIYRYPCTPVCPPNLQPGEGSPPCANPTCNPIPGGNGSPPPCPPTSPPPCIPSPGAGQLSPPCPTRTPNPCQSQTPPCQVSPPPCIPSPGAGRLSPPCATPQPPCIPSPGAGPLGPPCPTATPPSLAIALDCDRNTAGIQFNCQIGTATGSYDADVVIFNPSSTDTTVGSFNFDLHDSDTSRLKPLLGSNSPMDTNPDFNNALTGTWACLPSPNPDTGSDGQGKADSFLSCFTAGSGPALSPGASIVAATVHYVVPPNAGAGTIQFKFTNVSLASNLGDAYDCNNPPELSTNTTCVGATVTLGQTSPPPATATPGPLSPPPVSPPSVCADVNGDHRVTVQDLLLIARHIGSRHPSRYDIDHNGVVNFQDVRLALNQLGTRC